jgi:hypothetical protein
MTPNLPSLARLLVPAWFPASGSSGAGLYHSTFKP